MKSSSGDELVDKVIFGPGCSLKVQIDGGKSVSKFFISVHGSVSSLSSLLLCRCIPVLPRPRPPLCPRPYPCPPPHLPSLSCPRPV